MVVDRNQLRHEPVAYLGWYFEGEPGPLGTGTYRWHANEDRGSGNFRLLIDTAALTGDRREQYMEGMARGLCLCKGKVFLGTWRQGDEEAISLPLKHSVSGQLIRESILRGLYRLYEQGFREGDFQIDLDGVGLALGVSRVVVDRAVNYLLDEGLIAEFGTLGKNRETGDIWLATAGVKYVEQLIEARTSGVKATTTILFTDVEGSTGLTEELGDERSRALLREYEALVREAVRSYGGSEVKALGDGVMAAFPSATYAVRCAVAIQQAASEKGRTVVRAVKIKVGINAGDAIEEDDDFYGRAVNLAARLCQYAQGGEIIVSNVVRELVSGQSFPVGPKGPVELKGFADPVEVFAVGWRAGARPETVLASGDHVRHAKFGEGIVLSVTPHGNDFIIVVAFQGEAGMKKLLLSFAPLERVEAG